MLKDFLNELSQKILKIKIDFKTSNDKKTFLAGLKNFTGNIVNDEHLIRYGNLEDKEFLKKIDEIFYGKREEKIKLIGKEQYYDLERSLQILDFSESSFTIFRTIETSNDYSYVRKIHYQNLKKRLYSIRVIIRKS